uniref:MBD domain-containing protein n=1 Tax=Anopheles atroparvus TaxID=41427 RepID=A0AAG5DRG1_ANOAO
MAHQERVHSEPLAGERGLHQQNQQLYQQDEPMEEEEDEDVSVAGEQMKFGEKRRYSELQQCDSDEDDFAGFDEDAASSENGVLSSPRPLGYLSDAILSAAERKLAQNNIAEEETEPDSHSSSKQEDIENVNAAGNESNKSLIKRKINVQINTQDEAYKAPFKYGWKRELVYRANMDGNSKDKGEVYYITPQGKKLRTRNDIAAALHDDLTINNFTFAKEPVGGTPDEETIRSAKSYSNMPKRSGPGNNSYSLETSPGDLGKRVPKPKMPKGASPPPPSSHARSAPLGVTKTSGYHPQISPKIGHANTHLLVGTTKANENAGMLGKQSKPGGKMNKLPDDVRKLNNNIAGNKETGGTNDRLSDDEAVHLQAVASDGALKNHSTHWKIIRYAQISSSARDPSNFMAEMASGYSVLLQIFDYLKVQELLSACSVCHMWNHVGNHSRLWETVRMKNSYVKCWAGMMATLRKNGTRHLDLRKVLNAGSNDEMWQKFLEHIGQADKIEVIDLCRCSSTVVGSLLQSNPNLRVVNALAIKNDPIDFDNFEHGVNLEELRLKSSVAVSLDGDLHQLGALCKLRHLSLTSIAKLGGTSIDALGSLVLLESLELGECTEIGSNLATILPRLTCLKRLRLEKGQEGFDMFTVLQGISAVASLTQLELINCDVKLGFDKHFAACKNIRKLLLIPTYVSQSAATNRMVLKGLMKLDQTLKAVVWAITVELLRVTELYIDANIEDAQSQHGGSIPILKPVPGSDEPANLASANSQPDLPEEVEIVPLKKVQSILDRRVPDTKVQILKIPFANTWKQTMGELA